MPSVYVIRQWLLLAGASALLASCSSSSDHTHTPLAAQGEFIYRHHNETTAIPIAEKVAVAAPPWKKELVGGFPKISKEYFRCKGCSQNGYCTAVRQGETVRIYDCGGVTSHSLPLVDGNEFIFPILIKLLNYLQEQLCHRVVITSGHRCPEHNAYIDGSPANQYSKHMLGAEVSFYLEGLEMNPELVIETLKRYYADLYTTPDFTEFQRHVGSSIDVSIAPWYNKEIFIKLYQSHEGRNGDNPHTFPYIAIQVRYDKEKRERVLYSWDKAFNSYMRY